MVRPLGDPLGDRPGRVLGRSCAGEVEPLRGQRPLGEVDVLVPESGGDPAAGVEEIDAAGRSSRAPTAVTVPFSTSTSRGWSGASSPGASGTRRAFRIIVTRAR